MGYCTWADMNEANRIYHDNEWAVNGQCIKERCPFYNSSYSN